MPNYKHTATKIVISEATFNKLPEVHRKHYKETEEWVDTNGDEHLAHQKEHDERDELPIIHRPIRD